MNEGTLAISKLCERWWGRLAPADLLDKAVCAEELLRLLGWEQPIPYSPREGSAAVDAKPYILRCGGRNLAVFYAVPGELLEPPSAVIEHRLDFCAATRLLVDEAIDAGVPYAWITDFYRTYLYDTAAEDLLLWSDDPHAFVAHLAEPLSRAESAAGALDGLRRQPRSVQAKRFQEWRRHWTAEYSRRGMLPEHRTALILDRLTTARFVFQHDILRRTRPRLERRFCETVGRAMDGEVYGIGAELNRIFHDMWFDWRMDIFEPAPDVDEAVLDDTLTAPLLQEFALLAEAKFTLPVILESFNHGEPAEKLRVRMVPEHNEEREHYLSKQHLGTVDEARIEIDVNQEGYRAVSCWFDRMVRLYTETEQAFASRHGLALPEPDSLELFDWSEVNERRPQACADPFAHACDHGLGVYCSTPRQYRIARLLLTLHLVERYDATGRAVERFPHFRNLLIKRPTPLPAQRLMAARRPEPAERWSTW